MYHPEVPKTEFQNPDSGGVHPFSFPESNLIPNGLLGPRRAPQLGSCQAPVNKQPDRKGGFRF